MRAAGLTFKDAPLALLYFPYHYSFSREETCPREKEFCSKANSPSFSVPARDLSAPRLASQPPRSPRPPPVRLQQKRFPLTTFELSPRMEQRGETIVLSAVIYRLAVA